MRIEKYRGVAGLWDTTFDWSHRKYFSDQAISKSVQSQKSLFSSPLYVIMTVAEPFL
jgi:hypothetical protein